MHITIPFMSILVNFGRLATNSSDNKDKHCIHHCVDKLNLREGIKTRFSEIYDSGIKYGEISRWCHAFLKDARFLPRVI